MYVCAGAELAFAIWGAKTKKIKDKNWGVKF
jgi:hypothetical protein